MSLFLPALNNEELLTGISFCLVVYPLLCNDRICILLCPIISEQLPSHSPLPCPCPPSVNSSFPTLLLLVPDRLHSLMYWYWLPGWFWRVVKKILLWPPATNLLKILECCLTNLYLQMTHIFSMGIIPYTNPFRAATTCLTSSYQKGLPAPYPINRYWIYTRGKIYIYKSLYC